MPDIDFTAIDDEIILAGLIELEKELARIDAILIEFGIDVIEIDETCEIDHS